jgi:S1-C subfamily serine protease
MRRILLIGLAVVLLAGAVAVGVALGRSDNRAQAQPTASQTIPSPSKSSGPGSAEKINVAAIAKEVDPAVVDITSIVPSAGDELAGTGMILTSSGEVLTNNHVIANGTPITAQIDGTGKTYEVRVLGADSKLDVALVQLVGASGLRTVSVGNSSNLQVGDGVVAIGNALDLKGPPTVTEGIVSALDRSIQASDSSTGITESLTGLIQTDAPINPGNSGGPLVDAAGRVIGMDTAAATGSATQSATDIGFAIPIDKALSIAQQIQQGKASSTVLINRGGFIGVEVITISEAETGSSGFGNPTPAVTSGAYVAGVLAGTPASKSGLQEGDVIVAVGGVPVASPTALGSLLQRDQVGQLVKVAWVTPSGARQSVSLALIARPVA